jgi:hypothetical protein
VPFDNGSFEEPGSHAGEPQRWRLRAFVRSLEIAAFATPPRGHESFEWLALHRRLAPTDAVRAMFGAALEEGFSSWVIGAAQSFAEVTAQAAVFDTLRVERFAPGWGVAVFASNWNAVIATRAEFGGPADAFHTGWPGTAPRFEEWTDVASAVAGFDGDVIERFGAIWPLIS